jgi:hypothetical protein
MVERAFSGGGVGGNTTDFEEESVPSEEERDEKLDEGEGKVGARLSVTQSCDPLSGGHFGVGTSKAPLGSAREGGGIIIFISLHVANSDNVRGDVSREGPIPNGLTTVGGADTRLLFHGRY